MPHAYPRYSPVGSKLFVHPNSGSSSRSVPPFWTFDGTFEAPLVVLPPHATATRAIVTPKAAAAIRLRRLTDFTPFSLRCPNDLPPVLYGDGHLPGFAPASLHRGQLTGSIWGPMHLGDRPRAG